MSFRPAARQFFSRRAAPAPPLPYDAEVEYLQSTGTQYIDTGVHGRDGLLIKTEATRDTSVTTGLKYVFGIMPNPSSIVAVSVNIGTGRVTTGLYSVPASTSDSIVSDNSFHTYLLDTTSGDKYASIDDVKIRTLNTSNTGQTTSSIILFGALVNTSHQLSSCRIAAFSINDTTTNQTIIDFIPVRFTNELGQSEGAMYDRVSGALFRNAGTGAFLWAEKQ